MNNLNEDKNLDEEEHDFEQEPENVTREINLDDLYDGVINNTVVIDPITNDELLMKTKKNNFTYIGIIFAVIVLLVLYFVNNKMDIGSTTKEVEPKTTKKIITTKTLEDKNGKLSCTYSSKSDADSQTLTYTANYKNDKLINSNFNYVLVSSNETISDVVKDLLEQYETFYINNASVIGNNVTFEKHDKGFTFDVETDYETAKFEDIRVSDEQTVLYVKPTSSDTVDSLKDAYTNKGFTCTLIEDEEL